MGLRPRPHPFGYCSLTTLDSFLPSIPPKPNQKLPDPKRPDLVGLKPAMLRKLQRKQEFLKAVGASRAGATNDALRIRGRRGGKEGGAAAKEGAGAALGTGWADLGAMLEATAGADVSANPCSGRNSLLSPPP